MRKAKNFYLKEKNIETIKMLCVQLKTTQSILVDVLIENPPPKTILQKLVREKKHDPDKSC
jgi:hypothetical protein